MHTIYHGENLDILRRHVPDGAVTLVYIDPPFNTGKPQSHTRMKTVRSAAGDRVGFQGQRYETVKMGSRAFPDRFDDYIAFLEPRLREAYRVLAPDGTLYFHIDYREAHYCKVLLDGIFGRRCFLNEIIWAYDYGARPTRRWPPKHDTILVYVKDPDAYHFDDADAGARRRAFERRPAVTRSDVHRAGASTGLAAVALAVPPLKCQTIRLSLAPNASAPSDSTAAVAQIHRLKGKPRPDAGNWKEERGRGGLIVQRPAVVASMGCAERYKERSPPAYDVSHTAERRRLPRGDGGRRRHPDPPPHVDGEQKGSRELPESTERNQPTKRRGAQNALAELRRRPHRGGDRHDPVHELRQLRTVSRVVLGGAREHPGGDTHDHHEHEPDEQKMSMGRDEDARRIPGGKELGDDDVAAEHETRHQKHEAGLDVAADER